MSSFQNNSPTSLHLPHRLHEIEFTKIARSDRWTCFGCCNDHSETNMSELKTHLQVSVLWDIAREDLLSGETTAKTTQGHPTMKSFQMRPKCLKCIILCLESLFS